MGEWVLIQACRQAVEWQRAGLPALPIAINVSGVQFRRQDLCELVRDALRATGLAASLLRIEITETAIVSVRERAVELLGQLRELGVSLALDDFGTGYSSLSYLKSFPIDMLKIDRSFVAEMLTDHTTASIIEAIISMTRILGLNVLAEGVEDQAQFAFLQPARLRRGAGVLHQRRGSRGRLREAAAHLRQRPCCCLRPRQGSARNLATDPSRRDHMCRSRSARRCARSRRPLRSAPSNRARPPDRFGRQNHVLRTVADRSDMKARSVLLLSA